MNNYYFNQLPTKEQQCYKKLLSGCKEYRTEIPVDSMTRESFYKTYLALSYDHPEFFWLHGYQARLVGNQCVSMIFEMDLTESLINKEIHQIALKILAKAPKSSYERIKYIYDYIIDNTEYGTPSSHTNQDIRSVFLEHKSVCAGYSKAFKYLCDEAGIECIYVTGKADNGDHAWNAVRLNGQWYWVDCTWGDPVYSGNIDYDNKNYVYFFADDRLLFNSHSKDRLILTSDLSIENFSYPQCTDSSLYYYSLIHSFFTTFNYEEIKRHIFANIESGKKTIFKFSNSSAYNQFVKTIFTDGGMGKVIEEYFGKGRSYSITYKYSCTDSCYLVEVLFVKN
ncbi:MAG: hypothetical protein K6D97_06495 [Clostridia bacterium]|nr:hypothetical protein [Clostridia bacterium]